nr:MAG: RNA-dependent RNA polymerase [Rhizoctonia solani mitovirus 48]
MPTTRLLNISLCKEVFSNLPSIEGVETICRFLLINHMFIPLIFSMSVLVGLHYFNKAEMVYQWMVKQPLEYYIWFIVILMFVQLLLYIYRKLFPHVQGFYRSLSRITSRIDNLSNTIDRKSKEVSDSPFKNGSKRNFSVKSTNKNPLPSKVNGRNTLSRLLSSRRIKGLFASIVENGAMVSLDQTFSTDRELSRTLTKEEALIAKATNDSAGVVSRIIQNRDGKTFRLERLVHGSLSDLILGFGWRIISACFPNKIKFTARMRLLKLFYGYIFRMYKCNGATQVVKFLKTSQLALQKAIAGDKVDNLRLLDESVVRSRLSPSGLPVIIPSRDRKLIMSGQASSVVRFWLTLFSVYRVIKIPGTLKLSTIVAPLSANEDHAKVVRQFYAFLEASSARSRFSLSKLYKKADLLLLEAASSTHKVAWTGLFTNPGLLDSLNLGHPARNLMFLLKQPELKLLFDSLCELYPRNEVPPHTVPEKGKDRYENANLANPEFSYAGKLSIKEEAAGKLRVFAMVDVWSQTILKPIEQMLASFLKSLPNDGVYDQHSSELRARSKSLLRGGSFGYDLSAATDRLPLKLQSFILDLIVPNLGTEWATFLTKRDYYMYLPDDYSKSIGATYKSKNKAVPNTIDQGGYTLPLYYNAKGRPWTLLNYTVGQPMGALSSFAMLAVTHHFIAQFAYRLAYSVPMDLRFTKDTWYTGYECTGDDIILFDEKVAKQYLYLMAAFGVPINTMKSVVATKPATDYLKVTSANGQNVGAISWKMFMSGNSLMGRANILNHLLTKGVVNVHINSYIERIARLSPYSKNSNLTPTLIALWTMLANRNIISIEEAMKALINGKEKVFRFARAILMNADVNKITLALPKIYRDNVVNLVTSRATETVWSFEHPWFKITYWKPLAVFQAKADLEVDANTLTREIMEHCLSTGQFTDNFWERAFSGVVDYGNLDINGNLVETSPPNNIQENDMITLFTCLRSYISEKLGRIGTPLLEERAHMESPLPLLVTQNDELSRYNELKELVKRAVIKLDPDSEVPLPRDIRPSELSLLKLLRKMGNRPLFTTAASLW